MHASSIIEDLANVTRRMRTVFDALASAAGLSLSRVSILRKLHTSAAGSNQRSLAQELEIEGPTLVRLLDGLEDAGLILRCAVEGDRRAKQVVLTPAGRDRVADVEGLVADFRSRVLAGIAPEDLQAARRVLARMAANLEDFG